MSWDDKGRVALTIQWNSPPLALPQEELLPSALGHRVPSSLVPLSSLDSPQTPLPQASCSISFFPRVLGHLQAGALGWCPSLPGP